MKHEENDSILGTGEFMSMMVFSPAVAVILVILWPFTLFVIFTGFIIKSIAALGKWVSIR